VGRSAFTFGTAGLAGWPAIPMRVERACWRPCPTRGASGASRGRGGGRRPRGSAMKHRWL